MSQAAAAGANAKRRAQLHLVKTPDPTYAADIRKIKTGKGVLGMTDGEEDAMILSVSKGRTDSASKLTAKERWEVLKRMARMGFVTAHRVEPLPSHLMPRLRKLRAIWYALAKVGAVERPTTQDACDQAIGAWAKRLIQLQELRLAQPDDLDTLIERAKEWAKRVEAPTEPEQFERTERAA